MSQEQDEKRRPPSAQELASASDFLKAELLARKGLSDAARLETIFGAEMRWAAAGIVAALDRLTAAVEARPSPLRCETIGVRGQCELRFGHAGECMCR